MTQNSGLPHTMYIIRHGEKPPAAGPPFGIDSNGNQNPHSLTPRGWQRAGALVHLFAPLGGSGSLVQPTRLIAPTYGDPVTSANYRAVQTLMPLAQRLNMQLDESFATGDEANLAQAILQDGGVVLVAWEHTAIPNIVANFPMAPGTVIPQAWPSDRFDIVWRFVLDLSGPTPQYIFSQVPQLLLSGDLAAGIPAISGRGTTGLGIA